MLKKVATTAAILGAAAMTMTSAHAWWGPFDDDCWGGNRYCNRYDNRGYGDGYGRGYNSYMPYYGAPYGYAPYGYAPLPPPAPTE